VPTLGNKFVIRVLRPFSAGEKRKDSGGSEDSEKTLGKRDRGISIDMDAKMKRKKKPGG